MSAVADRVAAGAKFLDEHDPDWWRPGVPRAINLDTLDLELGDRCVLGQRCPLETLTAWLGCAPGDRDDYEGSYLAQAQAVSGIPSAGHHAELEAWAAAHGFNQPYGTATDEYGALTDEWKRVITERRAAP